MFELFRLPCVDVLMIRFVAKLGGILGLFLVPWCAHGQDGPSKAVAAADCIRYLNESTHFSEELRQPIETFNLQLDRLYDVPIANRKPISISTRALFDPEKYFVDSLCYGEADSLMPVEQLRYLYQNTKEAQLQLKESLPHVESSILYFYGKQIELLRILMEIEELCNSEDYLRDKRMGAAYHLLTKAQKAYGEYFLHHMTIQVAAQPLIPFPPALEYVKEIHLTIQGMMLGYSTFDSLKVCQDWENLRILEERFISFAGQMVEGKNAIGPEYIKDLTEMHNALKAALAIGKAYCEGESPLTNPKVADQMPYLYYGREQYDYLELFGILNHHQGGFNYYARRLLHAFEPLRDELPDMPYWFLAVYPGSNRQKPIVEVQVERTQTPEPPNPMGESPPANLIFLLDVSGSMKRYDKLPLLKSTCIELVKQMRPRDQVSIITYSGKAQVVLPPSSASEQTPIITAFENLDGKGKTDIIKGIKLAFSVAETSSIPVGTNRIILVTDGDLEGANNLRKQVATLAEGGTQLSIFLLGGSHTATTQARLSTLARTGKGNLRHIREENAFEMLLSEAKGLFVE